MMRHAAFVVPGSIDTLTGGYIYEKQLLLALRRIGWEVELVPVPGGFPAPSEATLEAVTEALAALPPERPVLLDGFLPGAMPPERLAALRAPFVAVTHHPLGYETGLSPDRARYLCEVERRNLARAAHVVVTSPHTAQTMIRDFGVLKRRVTVAPPGVLRPAAGEVVPTAEPVILSVGQIVPRKGHDVLLRALERIAGLPWQACIVGGAYDADLAQALRRMAEAAGLAERVAFAGQIGPEALDAHYRRASLFALATRYEGYGMVFAEALAYGLPIVTCPTGAVPDTVPADAALFVPPEDDAALAGALRRLLTEPALRDRLAEAARARGAALPGWEDTARIVGGILETVAV